MTEEKLFKINLSIKFKNDKGVRRFIIRADDFDILFDNLTYEMSVVAPNATAMYWTDGDGDKIFIGSGAELEEAYEQLAKNNNNVLNIETKEEEEGEKKEEKKEEEKKEEEKKPEPRKEGALHNAICDLCDTPIRGHRFRCIMCPDYDLCGFCESTGSHAEHAMFRIVDPAVTPFPWGAQLSQNYSRLSHKLDEHLRQQHPESLLKLENFTTQGVNRLVEVGNLLTNTLANFGIQATYEVRGKKQNNTTGEETPKDATPEVPKEAPKEVAKEEIKEETKEAVKETPKESIIEAPKVISPIVAESAPVTEAPKKAALTAHQQEVERQLKDAQRVVKRFTEDCIKAKEAAKKQAEEQKKEDPTKKYESVFAKVDRAAALAFPHLAESRDKVKTSEASKKVVPEVKPTEAKTIRSVFDQPREANNSVFNKNSGFSFAAKTESKPMFGGFKSQETVQKEQPAADRAPVNHVGPGIFSARSAKPKVERVRDERRRETSHRHRDFDYRSDDSVGRTPSPPSFYNRNYSTRGSRYEKEPASKTAANDEFGSRGFRGDRGCRDERGFTSARGGFGSGVGNNGFGSPFGEFNNTGAYGNGTSKRGGFDNTPTFGSSTFGKNSGCNSGFGSGGFGKNGGFGSGGFGKSGSYYDDYDRTFYPREDDFHDCPRFGKDSAAKGGFKGFKEWEPTPRGFGFVPPPKGFESASKGFEPSSKRFEPSPKGFEPSPKGFEPAPRGFDRPKKTIEPSSKGFGGFEPKEKIFEQPPRGFSTVSNSDMGFRDGKTQRGGFCNHYNPPAQEKFRPPRVSRPVNPFGDDPWEEDLASTLTTMMFKKKEDKTEEQKKKKNETVKKTKKVAVATVVEPVKDQKIEGVMVLPNAVENAEASLSLTTCQVEIEKKDPVVADAVVDVPAEINRVVAILDAPVNCGQTFVLTPTDNTQVEVNTDAPAVLDVTPSAPAVTDTQSIGSEVEHIEDVDSDGWVDAVAERQPETNIYPQLIEQTSTSGQAREETYAELLIMGFTDVEARRAIAHCGCELMQCIDYITEQQH